MTAREEGRAAVRSGRRGAWSSDATEKGVQKPPGSHEFILRICIKQLLHHIPCVKHSTHKR